MKKTIFFFLLTISTFTLSAQTFDEWFRQAETRIKYMLQQIAANKVYLEYLQKGYRVAQSGLQTISDIKHGDFTLHSDFFNTLANVNPQIKELTKVADIISFQIQIVRDSKAAIQRVAASGQLTSAEISYLQNTFDHLLVECTKNINSLIMVISSGETTMTDDERIRRIDHIYYDMQDKLSFCRSFSNEAVMLSVQRMNEQTDIDVSKRLNGLR